MSMIFQLQKKKELSRESLQAVRCCYSSRDAMHIYMVSRGSKPLVHPAAHSSSVDLSHVLCSIRCPQEEEKEEERRLTPADSDR